MMMLAMIRKRTTAMMVLLVNMTVLLMMMPLIMMLTMKMTKIMTISITLQHLQVDRSREGGEVKIQNAMIQMMMIWRRIQMMMIMKLMMVIVKQ